MQNPDDLFPMAKGMVFERSQSSAVILQGRTGDGMRPTYLAIIFLGVTAVVFTVLVALARVIG
jgi:hypothetical protein